MAGRAGRALSSTRLRLTASGGTVRRHPRHVVLFAAVAGLLAGSLPPPAVLAAGALTALVVAIPACAPDATRDDHGPGRAVPGPALALAALVAVLAGAAVCELRLAAQESGRLPALAGRPLQSRAVVLEPVRERTAGPAVTRVCLLDAGVKGEVAVMRVPPAGHPGRWPKAGEIVDLKATVAPLGRFDAYQRRRGAAVALDVVRLEPTGRRRAGAAGAVDAIRERAERGLDWGLEDSRAALLAGMVLGQDERLADEVRTDFQRSGLAHILAVSGQNVMLLCTLVLGLASLVGLSLRARLVLALALIALYVPLAGGGPSIQRAGVMGAAGLVAALAGRPASRWYALGLAASVTLALNPRSAGDPGWQLSFAAVVALLAIAPGLRGALARWLPAAVADAAAITIAATLGTAPLLAGHFEQLSLVSLPANLLAAPAVAPIMWLGMLSASVAQLSPALAAPLNGLNAPLLGYVEWLAHAAGAAPLAVLPLRLGSPVALTTAYGLLVAVVVAVGSLWRRRMGPGAAVPVAHGRGGSRLLGGASPWQRGRRRALAAAAAGLAAVAVAFANTPRGVATPPAPGELVVSFLDIGQGDATLLQRDGVAVLVDTGPPGAPILRRLREAGVRRLDALVITHAQLDHEGGAPAVMRAYPPRLLVDGGAGWPTEVQRGLPAAMRGVRTRRVDARAGQVLELGGMRLRVLWPPPPPPGWVPSGDPNDRAIVALVQVGDFDLLLPADAESNVTASLALPRVEALKVAHHGSADAGLPELLDRLDPRFAAIEVGRHNTYGHPTPSTLAALRTVPRVVRTDRDGTVRLRVRGDSMTFERAG